MWRRSPLLVQFGKHRASQCFLERLGEVLLSVGRDVESAIRLGKAFRIDNALLAGPRVILHAKRNDVHGEPGGIAVKLFAEIARRSAASLLAVSDNDDEAGLVLVVEHFGG